VCFSVFLLPWSASLPRFTIAIVNLGRVALQGSKAELVKGGEDLEQVFMRTIGGGQTRRLS